MAKRKDEPKWIPVAAKVILDGKLSAYDVRLFLYLSWRQGRNKSAWPSQETIAKDTNVSLRTVQRAVKNLEEQGLIEVKGTGREGRGHSYHYQVNSLMEPAQAKDLTTQEPGKLWLDSYERQNATD